MQQIARKGAPDWRKQKTKNNQKKSAPVWKIDRAQAPIVVAQGWIIFLQV